VDIDFSLLEDGIHSIFDRKGEAIVNMNLDALRTGMDFAEKNR